METLKEKFEEILNLTEKMFRLVQNGYPMPGTGKYDEFASLLTARELLIAGLDNYMSERDVSSERTVLHKIEKIETEMLSLMKSESSALKENIDTLEKGKKAVKNGYLNKYGKHDAKSLFSKRG